MPTIIDSIDKSLQDSNQNVINLTNPNYEADLMTVQEDVNVTMRFDIKIESQAMSGDSMIWGHPTRGVWGAYKWSDSASVGFILGHPIYGRLGFSQLGTNAAAWETVEELINV